MGIGNEYDHFLKIVFAEVVTVKMVKINGYYAQFYVQFVLVSLFGLFGSHCINEKFLQFVFSVFS